MRLSDAPNFHVHFYSLAMNDKEEVKVTFTLSVSSVCREKRATIKDKDASLSLDSLGE